MSTEVVAEKPISNDPAEPRRLGQVIATISYRLNADRIGPGELAELRRISRGELPAAFWRLYLTNDVVPPEWREPVGRPDRRVDLAWAALIRAMVQMAPNPHSFDRPFGTALAESGYSEDRFVRLLRAEGENLAREVRTAGVWLARKGVSAANWVQPARLLLGQSRNRGIQTEFTIHQLARDYFRAQATQS